MKRGLSLVVEENRNISNPYDVWVMQCPSEIKRAIAE